MCCIQYSANTDYGGADMNYMRVKISSYLAYGPRNPIAYAVMPASQPHAIANASQEPGEIRMARASRALASEIWP